MRFPGFIGGAYKLKSVNADCQRCVNLFPEINEQRTAPNGETGSLIGTPGLRLLTTIGTGPIRGVWKFSISGILAVVSGNGFYAVDDEWNATLLGTLNTSTGKVDMADNAYQILIVDGSFGYVYDGTLKAFSVIAGFPAADRCAFLDGYILFNMSRTGQFGFTNLNDASIWDPLDFQTVEGSPDNLVGLVVSNRQIWLPGTDTVEVFWDSGDAFNPFQRVNPAIIEFGCSGSHSMQKLGNSVMWLGGGTNGAGIVWRADGYQPTRVSTHAIEYALQASGDPSGASAWTYQESGHQFYCLNIPGQNTTWCYDLMTSLWHERVNFKNGKEMRHRADCHAFAYNTHVVGDYENGNLYALDPDKLTDDGDVIIRERTSPHVSDSYKRIFWDRLQIEAETGVGLDGITQGTDPQIMTQWSDDAGHTWSPERWTTLGKIGAYLTRAIWRRLGFSRSRVVRFRITDPVKVTILGANMDVRQGAN